MAGDSSGDNKNARADDHPHLNRDAFPQSQRANQTLRGRGAHWMETMLSVRTQMSFASHDCTISRQGRGYGHKPPRRSTRTGIADGILRVDDSFDAGSTMPNCSWFR